MDTQSYYQTSGSADDDTAAARSGRTSRTHLAVPRPLRWLVAGLVVYIVLLMALPLQMSLDIDALAASIREKRPELDPAHMDFAITGALIYSWGLHIVDVALSIWLVVKTVRGRQWARIALTAYVLIATAFSLISAAAGQMYLWAVISCDGMHVVMLVLLWAPPSVRRFFAAHRAKAVE